MVFFKFRWMNQDPEHVLYFKFLSLALGNYVTTNGNSLLLKKLRDYVDWNGGRFLIYHNSTDPHC